MKEQTKIDGGHLGLLPHGYGWTARSRAHLAVLQRAGLSMAEFMQRCSLRLCGLSRN